MLVDFVLFHGLNAFAMAWHKIKAFVIDMVVLITADN